MWEEGNTGDPITPVPDAMEISAKLRNVILKDRKGLRNMYGRTEVELDKNLEMPIKMGEEMARKLIREMGCSYEVAVDLTVLALYDVAILIDNSDSVIYREEDLRGKTLILYVDCVTEICSMANKSGIFAMRFMNSLGGKKNWTGKSQEYLNQQRYSGVAKIGTKLRKKILDKFAIGKPSQSRPLLVLAVTGGLFEDEEKSHLKQVILHCMEERKEAGKGPGAVRFQFSSFGIDPGAAQLLTELGQDPDLREHVDVLQFGTDFEQRLAADKWFVLPRILLGAILPDWGEQNYNSITMEVDYSDGRREDADSGDDWDDL
ncbi:hypothetical protein HOY80DRAFT_919114 [Tuber brumale]|nr:hypothetical protein HOY80DRAFT_919114 [Tuber brumale]